jgi:hypothetical protein
MKLDTYLDDVCGDDVELEGGKIGADKRITIRISGESPGAVDLIMDLDYAEIAAALTTPQRQRFGHRDWDDDLNEAGIAALAAAVLTLLNDRGPGGFSAEDVTIDPGGELRIFVSSLQGETLGDWADRAGRRSAEAVVRGYPDNVVALMRQ